jgi:signal transduction histidine kinase
VLPLTWLGAQLLAPAALGALVTLLCFIRRGQDQKKRIYSRIANDLHDDVGSTLSQIAVLSEVARRQLQRGHPGVSESLARIGTASREAVEGMGDVVWSLEAGHDRLSDLAQRMRRFASDVFSARDVELSFRAASGADDARLDPDVRRQIFLVFKESVHNAVRHSGCARAEVDFRVEGQRLVLHVRDDGRGFDATSAQEGHGLRNMRERARQLGGDLRMESRPGRGTEMLLQVPLSLGSPPV